MAHAGRFRAVFNRRSVKSLLVGSTVLVVAYCALVIVLNVSQARTIRQMDHLINVDSVVADLCLQSTAAMFDARRLEKEFLLNYQESGFDESRTRYITPLIERITEIRGNMALIRARTDDPEAPLRTLEIERELDGYRQGIEALAEKHGERGSPDAGIYKGMRVEAQAMEKIARESGADPLLLALLTARRAERYYVERERLPDARTVAKAVQAFTAAAESLPERPRRKIAERADRYLERFGQYVRATEAIAALHKDHQRSVETIDPLLESLRASSLQRVAARRRAIERSTRLLGLPVVVGGGVVLVVVAFFSLCIAVVVTRAVVESTSFAERIAAGDLDARLEPKGENEFFALQTALNAMAVSLRAAEAARREGTAALLASEEKHRAIVESSTDWIWEIDRAGRHTFSNHRVRNILGVEPGELVSAGPLELLHPEDAPRVRELLERSVSAGSGWQGVVLRWRHRDGTWRWLESNAVAVRDAAGGLVGFRGVDRDITERRRLERELVKAQKLEAIGTLAGGIAHDFNNLLQGLFGYISLARQSLPPGAEALEMLDQAERALTLSVNLTTQLLTFSKGGKPLKEKISLAAILEDPVKFALSGSRSGYRLEVAPDLAAVDGDAGQLTQVIQNIVLNASEAMPEGGTVEVAARNEAIAAGSNPLVPAGGDFVRVDVKDAGAGIDGKDLARIFDPYFTTKKKGSGLGLATAYSIMRGHNGFIDVTSRPGAGSVFSLYLPAAGVAASPAPAAPSGRSGATGRILVMDDEEMVRNVTARMVATLGHAVATAANGEEALELFRAARDEGRPFDVVLLDLTVRNGMGGEEAMRRLLALDPGVKAVVSSGYSDAAVVADYRAHGFAAHLKKPYRTEELRDCLVSLLPPVRS
jgi:PAS domain S-box-containing protein